MIAEVDDETADGTGMAGMTDVTGMTDAADAADTTTAHVSRIRSLLFPNGYDHDDFLLRYIQPGLVGLIDGTVSTLAPVFAAALFSGPHAAFIVGMATALGAGVSMGWSEALSDNGKSTGRGSAIVRGAITGAMTTIGGTFHTLPFLIPSLRWSLIAAFIVVAIELVVIAWVRYRFLHVPMKNSLMVVTLGGAIVLGIGVALGAS